MREQGKTNLQTRDEIAWALREWSAAVVTAENSDEAEIYADAIEVVLAFLDDRQAIADLIDAYTAPTAELTYLVRVLCPNDEATLQPRLLLGASCALRLRELMRQAIA
ncbi:MAG TPA: hypothetical protein VGF38_22105 [Ktedonobacterales bacterium]|jgi:hypothetical protein